MSPRFHIRSLDGLRALSFGLVFASHAGLDRVVPGGFGVTVFFFLSGFLITTLMRTEFDATRTLSLRNFYVRRALRILPPFYLVLLSACVLTEVGVLPGPLLGRAVLAQACHYANFWIIGHTYLGLPAGTGVYWSLAVEEHFYLLFPLLYLTLQKLGASRARQAIALAVLCGLILCWRCMLVYHLKSPVDRTYLGSDTRFDSILFGCLLAIADNPVLDTSGASNAVWKYALLPLGVAALVASFLIRDAGFRETFRYSLQGLALLPIFVCAMRFPEWGFFRVLNYRPIAWLGLLSYSLYLMHQVVLFLLAPRLEPLIGRVPSAAVSLGLTLALAWLMHVAVERPCARLRRRFSANG